MKRLIINADDYGICREVNDAIEDLIIRGKLKNVSVLVNANYHKEAVRFLLDNPYCSVGLHLNVVEGTPILPAENIGPIVGSNRKFLSISQLLLKSSHSPIAVLRACEAEWRAQFEQLLSYGISISHVDSHQHIHGFPPFWKLAVKLCSEYGIRALRTPSEKNWTDKRLLGSLALRGSVNISKLITRGLDLKTNDDLLGFKRAGAYSESDIIGDIKRLRSGVTELVCHPSLRKGVPYAGYRGDIEHTALSGNQIWEAIDDSGVKLTTWSEIAGDPAN